MAEVVSSSHVFEEALQAEIITSDLQLFDFCSLLLFGETSLESNPAGIVEIMEERVQTPQPVRELLNRLTALWSNEARHMRRVTTE